MLRNVMCQGHIIAFLQLYSISRRPRQQKANGDLDVPGG